METENGSVLTVTFYISNKSFVNQCCEEKRYLASNNVIFFFSFSFFPLLHFESSLYFKTEKYLQVLMPVMLTSLAVFTDGPSKMLL